MLHRGAVSIEEYLGEYGTYGQTRSIKDKYDQIRVVDAILAQKLVNSGKYR